MQLSACYRVKLQSVHVKKEVPSECNIVCRQKSLQVLVSLSLPFCECCDNSAPFGDGPKSAATLCGTCIKAYFCLAEFNENFVFKCSGSPAGFLLLHFIH